MPRRIRTSAATMLYTSKTLRMSDGAVRAGGIRSGYMFKVLGHYGDTFAPRAIVRRDSVTLGQRPVDSLAAGLRRLEWLSDD